MKKAILVGIAGASGSGKTSVAGSIIEGLGADRAVVIQEDSYYKGLSHLSYDERAATNFDHPDAFDRELLVEHLLQLLNGEAVSRPIYDYTGHLRLEETEEVTPRAVVILEGILVLHDVRLRELMDLRVFVDTPLDICLVRRLKRDVSERGRTVDSVIGQYERTVRPMYLRFVGPSKQYADIVIAGEGDSSVALGALIGKIGALLGDSS